MKQKNDSTLKNIWVVSELYYPEDTSTGYFLTKIAEGVARKEAAVSVLCSQPTYSERGVLAPWTETRYGVKIRRCWGARMDRTRWPGRLVNLVTISFSVFVKGLISFHRDDHVLVVTNPPVLPYLVFLACRIKRAKVFLLVHDVYPEVLVAAGVLKRSGFLYRGLFSLSCLLFKKADKVIVIGRDMARVVSRKGRHNPVLLPNWGDVEGIVPVKKTASSLLSRLGLQQQFVVQYCGNIGKTHGLQQLLDAAERLEGAAWFVVIGSGSAFKWVEQQVADRVTNVTLLPRCARHELGEYLIACDIAVISFSPGMSGLSVPSRMYNVMAAGRPILAVTDSDSELAEVVREEQIGWVVKPGDVGGVVDAVLYAKNNPQLVAEMGERARQAVLFKYSTNAVVERYMDVLLSD